MPRFLSDNTTHDCDIAIITLTLNSETYISETLVSIKNSLDYLHQKIPHVKSNHFVCDGGSDDHTLSIVNSFSFSNIIYCPLSGLYPSLDFAIRSVSAKYICYIHSDDFVSESFLYSLYSSAISSPNTFIYASDISFIDSASNVLWSRFQPAILSFFQSHTNLVLHPNCMYPCYTEINYPYSDSVNNTVSLDWQHINLLLQQKFIFKRCKAATYYFRIHPHSSTVKAIRSVTRNSFSIFSSQNISLLLKFLSKIYLFAHETNKLLRLKDYLSGKRYFS